MIYEHRSQPLLPRRLFLARLLKHTAVSGALLLLSLLIGVIGYRLLEGFSWIDALLNASMILGGMGPVNPLLTVPGKIFASVYAIFSGVIFLVGAGVIITPVAHRISHQLHLEEDTQDK
ncbi:MAG: hypothetical protein E4H33_04250 [Anaerolineales bacterium]|nr:MAG: hypothetical protein E4H33_04250 [Anaerolineales bacterium]